MLIHITRAAVEEADWASIPALDALDAVLRSHREGKHVVLIEPPELRRLAGLGGLSRMAKGTLRDIQARCAEIMGLRDAIQTHLCVSADAPWSATGDGGVAAPLKWFSDSEHAQATPLVGENLVDARVYRRLTEAFVARQRWRLKISAMLVNGGGSTSPDVLNQTGAHHGPFLCIADSDRECPGDHVGATARALLRVRVGPHQRVRILSSREAENLFPLRAFRAVFGSQVPSRYAGRLDAVDALRADVPGAWVEFIDWKAGLADWDLREGFAAEPARLAFWETFARQAQECVPLAACGCATPEFCGEDRDVCTRFFVRGFGPGMLEEIAVWMEGQSPHKVAETMGESLDCGDLGKIVRDVVAWCCALAPKIT